VAVGADEQYVRVEFLDRPDDALVGVARHQLEFDLKGIGLKIAARLIQRAFAEFQIAGYSITVSGTLRVKAKSAAARIARDARSLPS
jgi:hypothetical protein